MTITPIDLFASDIHLQDGGQAHAKQKVFDPEQEGWQLRASHVQNNADVHADHWEVHRDGEEIVSCLTGAIRLYFRAEQPGAEEVEIKLAAGTAVIVPRGQRHRIELDVPSDIMTVTVTRGSSLEARSKA